MDLCTVTNNKFIHNAINLANSYKINSYNKNVYVYCFDMSVEQINILQQTYQDINFKFVPKIVDYAYDPTAFFYKAYAINNCIKISNDLIYSDATNVFNKYVDIKSYLEEDALFLPYNNQQLTNQYWTTNRCFEKMNCKSAKIMPQYWAGFQVYLKTHENINFIQEYYDYMTDAEIALPNTSVKNPDGLSYPCLEHRQDQSVYSLLIHKYFRHQKYNFIKQQLFGDWTTFKVYDSSYKHDLENCCLSSRESKFNVLRFL